MRLMFTVIGFLIAALTTTAFADMPKKIKIATEGAYPPFNFKSADGKLGGFDVEIASALCAQMKIECEIVAQDWDGIIPGLVKKKYDAIIASMSITDERKKSVDFTGRYYSNHLRILAKKGSGIKGAGDLDGKAVGAQRSTVASKWLEDNLAKKVKVKLYDTQTAAYSDLEAGRLTAIVSDVYPAYDWLQKQKDYEFVGEKIEINDLIGIAVRKGSDELKAAFDTAIKALRESGEYKKINDKYFPFDIY
ncbi:MAG: transporter substrate-binding domain-containing protein [Methyloligellaceae bacterium]